MRRIVAVICVALGVFLLALAPLLRFWVAESLMRTPMDYYAEPVHRGENVSYFSIEDVEPVEGATVEIYTTLRADVAASSAEDDVVVWDQFTWYEDVETGYGITSATRRVGHDRITGEAVDGYDAAIDDESVVQSGQAYKFPFQVEQRDYEYYDTRSQQRLPIEFSGVETVEGVETYRFVQRVDPVKTGERTVPAELLGIDEEGDVEADEIYEVTRTFWVEPITGSPIKQSEDASQVARADEGEDLVLFEGEMTWTPETTEWYIDNASTGMTAIPLVRTTLPAVFLVVGVGLLALGGVLQAAAGRAARGRH